MLLLDSKGLKNVVKHRINIGTTHYAYYRTLQMLKENPNTFCVTQEKGRGMMFIL
jgi:hypothetical protein